MGGLEFEVVVVIFSLVTIAVSALFNRGTLRALLLIQAGYWMVSYVLRPLVLLVVQPTVATNDSLADPRLVALGYREVLTPVLGVVAFGLASYALLVVMYTVIWGRKRQPAESSDHRRVAAISAALFAVGMAARIILGAGMSGTLVGVAAWVATAGAIGLLVYWRSATRLNTWAVLGVVVASQLWWTIESGSKTPAIAVVVALIIRVSLSGTVRAVLWMVGSATAVLILSFPILQSIKIGENAGEQQIVDERYPFLLQPLLPLIRRFDLVSAMTDAYFAGPGSWLDLREYANQALLGLVPDVFGVLTKTNAGLLWARDVRAQSLVGANTEVSLADGFIAEGYVLGGTGMVLLEALLLFAAVLVVARALDSKTVIWSVWAMLLLSFPILFERGSLGLFETVTRALLIAGAVAIAARVFVPESRHAVSSRRLAKNGVGA